jgi:hypothetical protein
MCSQHVYNTQPRFFKDEKYCHQACATTALNTLKALFVETDVDGSGTLSADDLTTVSKQYYRTEGKSRSTKAVQREVDEAMVVQEQHEKGALCVDEFVHMVLTSSSFNFGLPTRSQALMSELQQSAVSAQESNESEQVSSRGTCEHCGHEVKTNQSRKKTEGGNYVHLSCIDGNLNRSRGNSGNQTRSRTNSNSSAGPSPTQTSRPRSQLPRIKKHTLSRSLNLAFKKAAFTAAATAAAENIKKKPERLRPRETLLKAGPPDPAEYKPAYCGWGVVVTTKDADNAKLSY